jgi:hypothetical protein
VEKLNKLEELVNALTPGSSSVSETLKEWTEYEEMLLPHFREEEELALPLQRAYFTPKDMAPLVAEAVKRTTPNELGAMIYFEGPDNFRSSFMKQEGIPFFVWYIDFYWKLEFYKRNFVELIDLLKSGDSSSKAASECVIL